MASSSQYGGYDLEFVGEVADRFNCQICTKVIREPHLAVCCGQHYCESCLDKWFQKHRKKSCPHCRAEGAGFNYVINKGLRSEINQLKIKYSNRSKVCEWTGELGLLKIHLESDKGCGFVGVNCPNKCNSSSVLLKKDLNNHLKSECFHRQYQCEHCGHKDTYAKITGEPISYEAVVALFLDNKPECHYDICPEFPLACPNKCGTSGVKRKDMHNHHRGCPKEPVECPFAEAGCKSKLRRHQLDSHVTSNQQQHLLLVMGAYKEMKVKLQDMKVELQDTKIELQDTKVELQDTKVELQDMKARLTTAVQLLRLGTEVDKETVDFVVSCPKHLKKIGDSVTVTMPRVSEYHRTGKTWNSSHFYYREGYKFYLGVVAKVVKSNERACVSVEIFPCRQAT